MPTDATCADENVSPACIKRKGKNDIVSLRDGTYPALQLQMLLTATKSI